MFSVSDNWSCFRECRVVTRGLLFELMGLQFHRLSSVDLHGLIVEYLNVHVNLMGRCINPIEVVLEVYKTVLELS